VHQEDVVTDPLIRRINIGVHPSTVEAIQRLMIRHDISLPDAVHRLVQLGDLCATAVDVDHAELVLRHPDGRSETVRWSQ
jgi:hypothetical protein